MNSNRFTRSIKVKSVAIKFFSRFWFLAVLIVVCAGCSAGKKRIYRRHEAKPAQGSQPERKKTYFNRNEYEQSGSFRLITHMSYEELEHEKNRFKKSDDLELAAKYIGQMVKKCDNPDTLRQLYLELDDMLFDLGRYEDAAFEYQRYMQLYPGDQQAAYAHYRAILALEKRVLSPDRDQTHTHEVVKLAKEFAQAHKSDTRYLTEVEAITSKCLHTLHTSEVLKFYFYLNRNKFKAARGRLDYIKKTYLPVLPDIEAKTMVLEYELEFECQNNKAACECKDALCKRYPSQKIDSSKRREYAHIFSNVWS